jgi:2-polyprenyl-3-methyl-5-hydroxy-6-metoxy-1,4-benzoquinol methylase
MSKKFRRASSKFAKETYQKIKIKKIGNEFTLGPYNTFHLLSDPKRIGFLFARYKFVAKMLEGFERVLEIGCQEGLGSLVVAKAVKRLVAIDFYKPHIESCLSRLRGLVNNIDFKWFDITEGPVGPRFNGAFSLDVLEHIDPKQEDKFMKNVITSLADGGVLIIGMPSLESQKYASSESRVGHINCKSGADLRRFCEKYFNNVFVFGMNDEVLHTGFLPMSHYLLALCVGPKRK